MIPDDPAGGPAPDAGSTEIPPGLQAAPGVPVNGHGAVIPPTSAQQTAQAAAALVQLVAQFPQQLVNILSQVPVRVVPAVRNLCAPCVLARLQWQAAHAAGIRKAEAAAKEAHGLGPDDPAAAGLDWVPFLDQALRPGAGPQGITPLNPSITTVNGTEVCADHIPGKPGATTLLIATASLAPSQMGRFAA